MRIFYFGITFISSSLWSPPKKTLRHLKQSDRNLESEALPSSAQLIDDEGKDD
jgi:hypothetical protein